MTRRAAIYWTVLATTVGLYLVMLLWSLPHLQALAGGIVPFDMRPGGYSEAEARALVAALGPEGRAFYLSVQHRLDIVYPALLSLSLAGALLWLARAPWSWGLAGLAVLVASFDWLENAAVAAMLRAGPDAMSAAMVARASFWTVAKSGATTLAMAVLLGLLAWRGWRMWRGRGVAAGS